jgi:hypothetical protein
MAVLLLSIGALTGLKPISFFSMHYGGIDRYTTEQCDNWQDALRRSLPQFLDVPSVNAYFRTQENGTIRFNGLIAWEKGSNCISWTWNKKINGEQTFNQPQAIFQDSDAESEWHCAEQLDEWIIGNPFRAQQWALIRSDFERLWTALALIFGKPKIVVAS